MILSYLPVALLFASGFIISKLIPQIKNFNFAEKIAIYFCLGLLISIVSTFVLGWFGLISFLLPVSLAELIIPLALLMYTRRKIRNYHLISKPTLLLVILVVLLVSCFLMVSFRPIDFIRTPDDYKDVYWARTLMTGKILSPGSLGINGSDYSSEFWPWLQKYAYGLSLAFFFKVGDYSLQTGQVLSALFYSMLILGTYLLGSLRSKKTGLIAAVLVAFNPLIFLFSDHMMTDIPSAALGILALYFFIKSYESKQTNRQFLVIALIFAGISVLMKGTAIFLYPFVSIYALWGHGFKIGKTELLARFLPILVFASSFLADAFRMVFSGIASNSWRIFVDPLQVFYWSRNDWVAYLFSSPLGGYGTFIFPYFYTFPVALLALMGCLYMATKERGKLNLLLFATLVYVLWEFTTSPALTAFVRHVFIIFPIIMYFAAIGLQSRRYSLMVIPFFLLLLLIPEQGYVPYVQNSLLPESFLITMKWIGVTFVVLLLLIDFPLKKRTTKLLRGFESLTGKRILGINFKDLSVIALICLTVGASFYSCLFYAQNAPLDVNENTTIETTGIKQAVMWVDSNIPQNSRIATNNFYEFPFFLSYLSSRNYSLVYLPGAETTNVPVDEELNAFLSLTSNGSVDYLIIFTVLGYMYWYPYLGDYVNNPPPGMYEVNRTSTFVIYKAWSNVGEIGWQGNFSQGWRNGWSKDPRGSYQMSSSGVETVDGSLHVFGLSSNGDKTPWAHWMAISTSVPSINVSSYPYLIVNFRNYNNTELQVDVVINGNVIYSVDVAKPGNMTSVIDLRESVPSGNVTEILLLARTSGENMILNVYVNRILLARSME